MAFARTARTLTVLGTTALLSTAALATVESSCPAPCSIPPRTTLFVRDAGGSMPAGNEVILNGTLLKGVRKTVLRVEATITMLVSDPNITRLTIAAALNNLGPALGEAQTLCDSNKAQFCTATGSFWFDVDALEAAHPGLFLGQPLNIQIVGTPGGASATGALYTVSFSAQVVKKK
jgi:hypothetical protein